MAYTEYNPAKPNATTENGTTACDNIRYNEAAIRDAILMGGFAGWDYAQSGGTATEPATATYSKGAEKIKQVFTWSGGQVTTAITSYSANTGTTYDAVATAIMTYSSGELTTATGAGGFGAKILSLFGKITSVLSTLTSHTAATGTSVHGLKDMATQTSTAVTITGGSLNSVTIGGSTAGPGTFTIEREAYTSLGTLTTGTTTTINASTAGWYELTLPNSAGTCTFVLSGAAPSNFAGGVIVNIVTGATVPTLVWDATSVKWPSGTAPTLTASKNNMLTFMNRHNNSAFFGSSLGNYA